MKFPEPGRVKTRIAREVGGEGAARIYRELTGRVLGRLPVGWEVVVVFDPPGAEAEVREWLEPEFDRPGLRAAAGYWPQAPGGLGERLEAAFARSFEGRTGAGGDAGVVAAVGSDCVELGEAEFEAAVAALDGGADVVFGPAYDGGYYLVAMREFHPAVFRGVPWSSGETLRESLAAAERAGLATALLRELRDVDELGDWERVAGE